MKQFTYDKELVVEILEAIFFAGEKIIYRFSKITSVDDFTNSLDGMETLDSICMQLIAIGESLKNIDKITGNSLLSNYDAVDWRGAKGLRDIITHQYFDIDAEQIFSVCEKHIPLLLVTIKQILSDLQAE